MPRVTSCELRNDTAGVLRRIAAGEDVVITVDGRPVAHLLPVREPSRRWIGRHELVSRLRRAQADPEMRADLDRLAGEDTEELGPLR